MRVIVCGGRDYADRDRVCEVLSHLPGGATVVHGGAKGADTLAHLAARDLGLATVVYPAEWSRYGKRAGMIRNRAMAADGADVVIAFPGGKGTAGMVREAESAGIPVVEIADLPDDRKTDEQDFRSSGGGTP